MWLHGDRALEKVDDYKGHQETFEGDRNVHYLDCGDDFAGVIMSRLIKLSTLIQEVYYISKEGKRRRACDLIRKTEPRIQSLLQSKVQTGNCHRRDKNDIRRVQ